MCVLVCMSTLFFFCIIRLPPKSTRTGTPFPYPTLCRSAACRACLSERRFDLCKPVLAEEDFAADEKGRNAEHAARDRRFGVGGQPCLDFWLLRACKESRAVEAVRREEGRDDLRVVHLKPFLPRSEEHTSELQSLMRISYAVFCLYIQTTKITIVCHYQ